MSVHVIEHQRVTGGDWLRVQTCDDDTLEYVQEVIAGYSGLPGAGAWRIRKVADVVVVESESRAAARPVSPSLWERLRWRWIMLTSRRGRG